jgi:hypothetical protein
MFPQMDPTWTEEIRLSSPPPACSSRGGGCSRCSFTALLADQHVGVEMGVETVGVIAGSTGGPAAGRRALPPVSAHLPPSPSLPSCSLHAPSSSISPFSSSIDSLCSPWALAWLARQWMLGSIAVWGRLACVHRCRLGLCCACYQFCAALAIGFVVRTLYSDRASCRLHRLLLRRKARARTH